MNKKNCFTYVVRKLIKEGGSVIIRQSGIVSDLKVTSKYHPVYWMVHFMHMSKAGEITEYTLSTQQVAKLYANRGDVVRDHVLGGIIGLFSWFIMIQILVVGYICSIFYTFDGEIIDHSLPNND